MKRASITANILEKAIDREEMIADRFFAAIDAVTDPATGEAVCRSSVDPSAIQLTTPFNIFQFTGGATSRIVLHLHAR